MSTLVGLSRTPRWWSSVAAGAVARRLLWSVSTGLVQTARTVALMRSTLRIGVQAGGRRRCRGRHADQCALNGCVVAARPPFPRPEKTFLGGLPDEVCAKLTTNMSRKQWREWVSPD